MKRLVLIGLIICPLIVNAQEFDEVTLDHFEGVKGSSIAYSDVDGDGDIDVFIAGLNASLDAISKLYLNDGLGNFTESTENEFVGVEYGSVAFSDLDNDDDFDLLITGESGFSKNAILYLNDGLGIYTEMPDTIFAPVSSSSIAFSDVDGDGDSDVLISGEGYNAQSMPSPQTKLYINDGLANFIESTTTFFIGVKNGAVAFSDVDGDNDEDIIITGNPNALVKLYLNDGLGNFTAVNGTSFIGVSNGALAFSDVDGDNDNDVLISGRDINNNATSKLYLNDGFGIFSESISSSFLNVSGGALAFTDIDGDEDNDLLITGYSDQDMPSVMLYINDGQGNFTEQIESPFEGVYASSQVFFDADGDNDSDVVVSGTEDLGFNHSISKLYTNDGAGHFVEQTGTPFTHVGYSSVAYADVDGDSDFDLLIAGEANSSHKVTRLYLNNGQGYFTQNIEVQLEGVNYGSVEFSDVDGDNDQDILVTGRNNSNARIAKLYINDGTGNYLEMIDTPFEGVMNSSVAFSDVDGDTDNDLVISGNNGSINISELYLNDGQGVFTEILESPFDGVSKSSIAFSDVDGDNDNDILITGNNNSQEHIAKLYLNDGLGNFSETLSTNFEGVEYGDIAFEDIDNDGDEDVVITGALNDSATPSSKLYINNGLGEFTEILGLTLEGVTHSSVAFSDVDGDNFKDLLITGQNPYYISKLYLNDGQGGFSENLNSICRSMSKGSIAFVDVDNDNDEDLILNGKSGVDYSRTNLYINNGYYPPLSILENKREMKINLYPNPSNENLVKIEIDTDLNQKIKVILVDLEGRELLIEEEGFFKGKQWVELDVSNFAKGVYFVRVEIGKKIAVEKLVLN